ncbi:MAG: hypothetical protein SFZ03_03405 [Candidatus Melainabacteria bacterium]|nr:hypothetical protein [Candidatus Melainabacteria bacterium]
MNITPRHHASASPALAASAQLGGAPTSPAIRFSQADAFDPSYKNHSYKDRSYKSVYQQVQQVSQPVKQKMALFGIGVAASLLTMLNPAATGIVLSKTPPTEPHRLHSGLLSLQQDRLLALLGVWSFVLGLCHRMEERKRPLSVDQFQTLLLRQLSKQYQKAQRSKDSNRQESLAQLMNLTHRHPDELLLLLKTPAPPLEKFRYFAKMLASQPSVLSRPLQRQHAEGLLRTGNKSIDGPVFRDDLRQKIYQEFFKANPETLYRFQQEELTDEELRQEYQVWVWRQFPKKH